MPTGAPRLTTEDGPESSPQELQTDAVAQTALIDVDESGLADSFELPGAFSDDELLVRIVPVQADEFTCMSCFLVHHRSQLAREKDSRKYRTECES
jgi:hypothetical protein